MKWLLLLFPFSLFSAYIGNPADPAIMNTGFFSSSYPFFKFTTGYIADYISDKRYVSNQKDGDIDPNYAFRHFGLHSQLASLSMIVVERLELYGYVGGSKEHVQYRKNASISELQDIVTQFQSTYQFSWGTGGRAILLQWGQTFFTTDFTYFAVPSSPKSFFKFLNRLNLPMDLTKQKTSLREWQLSAALASRFFFITPYFGGMYLHSRLKVASGPEVPALTYRNAANWGYFFGFTVSLTGRFHANFERRMHSEFAYAFSTIAVF